MTFEERKTLIDQIVEARKRYAHDPLSPAVAAVLAEFRQHLEASSDRELERQAVYWIKGKVIAPVIRDDRATS